MPIKFAAIGLNHSHIYGQVNCLLREGAELVAFHSPEEDLAIQFAEKYPQAKRVADRRAILEDKSIALVLTAAILNERAGISIEAMRHGKDVMSDKPGMTTLEQLAEHQAEVLVVVRLHDLSANPANLRPLLTWFNADTSRTLPSLALTGDVSLSHDGANWLATFSTDYYSLLVQRGTTKNQAVIWTNPGYPNYWGDHASALVGTNLAVLLAKRTDSLGPSTLLFQRFPVPAGTSTAFTAPTPPIDILPGMTVTGGAQRNFALVATSKSAVLAVWSDSRWGAANELYAVSITIPACP